MKVLHNDLSSKYIIIHLIISYRETFRVLHIQFNHIYSSIFMEFHLYTLRYRNKWSLSSLTRKIENYTLRMQFDKDKLRLIWKQGGQTLTLVEWGQIPYRKWYLSSWKSAEKHRLEQKKEIKSTYVFILPVFPSIITNDGHWITLKCFANFTRKNGTPIG